MEEVVLRLEPAKVINYLREREKVEGEFSFAVALYPDIEDTYYAMRTLQLLGVGVDQDKTAVYLRRIHWMEVSLPRTVYMVVYLHLALGMELTPPLTDLLEKDWSRFQILDAQYYRSELENCALRYSLRMS